MDESRAWWLGAWVHEDGVRVLVPKSKPVKKIVTPSSTACVEPAPHPWSMKPPGVWGSHKKGRAIRWNAGKPEMPVSTHQAASDDRENWWHSLVDNQSRSPSHRTDVMAPCPHTADVMPPPSTIVAPVERVVTARPRPQTHAPASRQTRKASNYRPGHVSTRTVRHNSVCVFGNTMRHREIGSL